MSERENEKKKKQNENDDKRLRKHVRSSEMSVRCGFQENQIAALSHSGHGVR